MAITTDRVATGPGGLIFVDVIFENTGQQLVDHFVIHNEAPDPVRIRVHLNGSITFEEWYGGGAEKNPEHPNIDTDVLPPSPLSWRRATKSTNWSMQITYPSFPPV